MQSEAYKDDEAEQNGRVNNGVKCHRCEINIDEGALFCPTCGLPVIKNILNGKQEDKSPDKDVDSVWGGTEALREENREAENTESSLIDDQKPMIKPGKEKRGVNRFAVLALLVLLTGTAFSWVFCVAANVQGILPTEVAFWLLFLLLMGNAVSSLILAVVGLIREKKSNQKLGFPIAVMVMACLGMLATLLLYLQAIL